MTGPTALCREGRAARGWGRGRDRDPDPDRAVEVVSLQLPLGAPACSRSPSSPRTSSALPLQAGPSQPGPPLGCRGAELGLCGSSAFREVSRELGVLFPAGRERVHRGSSGLALTCL